MKEQQDEYEKYKQTLIWKKLKYAKLVKETKKPEVSDKKWKEIEEIKKKIHTLPLYMIK